MAAPHRKPDWPLLTALGTGTISALLLMAWMLLHRLGVL